jgi:hypothetical protein
MDYTIFDGLALSDLIPSPALLATDAIINKGGNFPPSLKASA